jgi:transposase
MSRSLLYHAFGIRGKFEYVRTEYHQGKVILSIRQPREHLRCPHCGSPHVHFKTHRDRVFRTVPIGARPVYIHLPVARVACQECATNRQVKLPFANPRFSYTHSFERYALELSTFMTIQDAADHLEVSWDVIKEIQKRNLRRRFSKPRLRNVRQIAIDEVHMGRGARFATVVLDLESGAVVFVGKGRGIEALRPFWKRLRSSHARIEAVATDMAGGYIAAVREFLPEAVHVFDHFHVVKLYNEKLTELRRELHREATEMLHKQVLKGIRWLLLRNPDNLSEEKGEPSRLLEALQLNQSLATAYYLKEALSQIWKQDGKAAATHCLDDWVKQANASGIRIVMSFAKTLQTHRNAILAWYDYQISTGPLEATNNKIQLLKRKAYGYRDQEFFHLKIYALHLSRYELVG